MVRQVKILRAAKLDIERAYEFYEGLQEGLGRRFMESISVDIRSLRQDAGIHVKIHGCFRMLAKRFPYAVYYRVLGQQYQVNIIRVLDCRQDPQTTRRSLS